MSKKSMRIKSIIIVSILILSLGLSACAKDSILQELPSENGEVTAYLFSRKVEGTRQYCLSLIKKGEQLDMEAEPNAYKSNLRFEAEWGNDNMLLVAQNKKDDTFNDFKTVEGIDVVFGSVTAVK